MAVAEIKGYCGYKTPSISTPCTDPQPMATEMRGGSLYHLAGKISVDSVFLGDSDHILSEKSTPIVTAPAKGVWTMTDGETTLPYSGPVEVSASYAQE